jgi:hypothetical protein
MWFCRACLDARAENSFLPFMPVNDGRDAQDKHPPLRSWEEWRHKEQQPGRSSAPHRGEPIRLAPIPPYDSPITPDLEWSPGPGEPEQVPEVQRGKAPMQQPRERDPGMETQFRAPEVVYVPVPPAQSRPAPTQQAPIEQIPIHRPEPIQSAPVMITHLVQPDALPEQARPVPRHIVRTDLPIEEERQSSNPPAESKRNFEKPQESKKEFDPVPIAKKEFDPAPEIEADAPVFDRDGDQGRWRTDEQVRELVIYRWEFKRWPDDVENKASKETRTGLESYYELRYFKEGTNRKGERYGELYGKHRAKRDLWIEEECKQRAIQAGNAPLDPAAAQSNMVHFPARRTHRAR